MRIARPALAVALVASVTAAGAASAAVKPKIKPVCNLVTDPAGDASAQAPLPNDDSLDIVGADVASDAKNFTAVIRFKNVSAQGLSQLGGDAQVDFQLPGAEATVWIGYNNSAYGGQTFQYGLIGKGDAGSTSPTGDAVGIVDTAKNEIRMTVPVSAMNALGKAKPGSKVSGITVSTSQVVGVAPNATGVYAFNSVPVDDASATKTYIAGNPSCVQPGK